jgi:3-oxoacyl-[acyl-carrier-protein] synthase II
MNSPPRRAVITGIGTVNPIGKDLAGCWDFLREGKSGIHTIQNFNPAGLPVRFAGEVVGFDAKEFVDKKDRKSLRMMARSIQLAVAAAQLALDDSQIETESLDPTRFGVEFGASLIASELEELGNASLVSANGQPGVVNFEKWGSQGLSNIPPLWMLKYLPNMLACHISIMHNAQGPNNTITESDVAGMLALGEAFRILGRNQADYFLVGGAESRINPLSMVRQCLFQPLSKHNEDPTKACRPYDRNRDGMVLGEGASVLVLEELEHARKRGAKIYGELVGFGAAFDRGLTGRGLARAVRAALAEAQIKPEEVDHINGAGAGTLPGDACEARGLQEVFGDSKPGMPVFAAKSYVGNLGAGSGPTEILTSLLALKHGQLPATLNYQEPDPACPITVSAGGLRPISKPYFLKTGLTEVGQCAATVFRQWE